MRVMKLYNFRQVGGYSDGTFKELSEEQVEKNISTSGNQGSRRTHRMWIFAPQVFFGKVPAEVSYMDKNCTKWSYATPTTGREPEKSNEIAMDTVALKRARGDTGAGSKGDDRVSGWR